MTCIQMTVHGMIYSVILLLIHLQKSIDTSQVHRFISEVTKQGRVMCHFNSASHYPFSIQRIYSEAKIKSFIGKCLIFSIFLFKTLIVGAVLTSTHKLCFGAKIRI